jgi:hypothetical protein
MKHESAFAQELTPGTMLWQWTKEARAGQGRFQHLQVGPDGVWNAMVVANNVSDPRDVDGFGFPAVHRVDVMYWNDSGGVKFETLFLTAGTVMQVISD